MSSKLCDTHIQLTLGRMLRGGVGGLGPYQDCLGVLQAAWTGVYMWFHLALLGCSLQTLTLANLSKKEFIGRMSGAHRSDRSPEKQTQGGVGVQASPKGLDEEPQPPPGSRKHLVHMPPRLRGVTSNRLLCLWVQWPLSLGCLSSDDPTFLGLRYSLS